MVTVWYGQRLWSNLNEIDKNIIYIIETLLRYVDV